MAAQNETNNNVVLTQKTKHQANELHNQVSSSLNIVYVWVPSLLRHVWRTAIFELLPQQIIEPVLPRLIHQPHHKESGREKMCCESCHA